MSKEFPETRLAERKQILSCLTDQKQALARLNEISSRTSLDNQVTVISDVQNILNEVKQFGDEALFKLTMKFDGFIPKPLEISSKQILEAWEESPNSLKEALKLAKTRIEHFHKLQIPKDFIEEGIHGEIIGRRCTTVVIAHRLNTLSKCDYIYEIKDGLLICSGSYDDLCNPNHPLGRSVKV